MNNESVEKLGNLILAMESSETHPFKEEVELTALGDGQDGDKRRKMVGHEHPWQYIP